MALNILTQYPLLRFPGKDKNTAKSAAKAKLLELQQKLKDSGTKPSTFKCCPPSPLLSFCLFK